MMVKSQARRSMPGSHKLALVAQLAGVAWTDPELFADVMFSDPSRGAHSFRGRRRNDIQKNRCRTIVASRFGETPAKTAPYRGSDRLSRPRPGRLEGRSARRRRV